MSFAHHQPLKSHPLIDQNHLQANGKLFKDSQIRLVKEVLANEASAVFAAAKLKELIEKTAGNGEITPEDKQLPFRVLKLKNVAGAEDGYFAIYKGQKQGKALGVGAGGVVKLIQDLDSGELYALKVISYDRSAASEEFRILKTLEETYGSVVEKNITGEFSAGKFYFIMRLGKGKNLLNILEDHLNGTKPLSTSEWLDICSAILKAVHAIHQKGVYHRDLKLENILYDSENQTVKIVDFGTACLFSKENPVVRGYPVGTEDYQAPEIEEQGKYSDKTEIFALGVLFKELLGYKPFKNPQSEEEIPPQNKSTHTSLGKVDEELASLLKKMTRSKPENRCTLEQAYQKLSLINANFLHSLQPIALEQISLLSPTSSTNSASTSSPGGFFSPASKTLSPLSFSAQSPLSGNVSPKRKIPDPNQEQKTGPDINIGGGSPFSPDKKQKL